ncbi:uncharacterized protein LACBIDRAFT_329681 [Laccaria bicolor S238N-H82]|uniref:Predicted protein n=1 Tax=Laccaria bicolor (strain S238N-H82 / ATCC MYA-4686) TaxID=486041 RepID=B0DIU4_LACBS|nr:uncharacterized protein LACBIDRAFT_329681 [Laccaria bicolor S238N-H82]EDR05402.1 predicted protein [Laccaria bicolor S238N-H82]|eukprot:XP_001883960.1 predicted protein [Laccaria bicolor S238N-H82]
MSFIIGDTTNSERPQRSRNARAQARHRKKRKAYIEYVSVNTAPFTTRPRCVLTSVAQLEETVAMLQMALTLREERAELWRMVAEVGGTPTARMSWNSLTTYPDGRYCDQDHTLVPSETPPHVTEPLLRPPPLTTSQSASNYHCDIPSNTNHHGPGPSLSFGLHAPAFPMPNTLSGSSATSSPPFSPIAQYTNALSNYTQHPNQYISVEVEDDASYIGQTAFVAR